MYPVIPITDEIVLPTYLLLNSLIFCFGIVWAVFRARRRSLDLNETMNFSLAIMLGGFFGARLMHIFYEAPHYYQSNPMDVFKVWQGGFVFYGGALGALLATGGWAFKKKLNFLAWADLFAPIFAAGYGLGRVACFLNGCCYGKICELPWGVHFSNLNEAARILRHPTQLYATGWEFVILAILFHLEFWSRKSRVNKADPISKWYSKQPVGALFFIWVLLHSFGRIFLETYRDDPRGFMIVGFSISTWLSFAFLSAAIFFFFFGEKKKTPTQ